MIKVIIAEDKPLILRNIKEKIQSFSSEIVIVGEATDGQTAFSLITELKPDIVFTDIRMPVMDGLKLITEVRRTDPELHFVIISGYDEFEYARQAVKLNVSDYLLKPLKQDELNEILINISEKLRVQKLESTKITLQNILNSNSSTETSSNIDLCYNSYRVILLNAGPYASFVIDYSNPFNAFWASKNLESLLSKKIGSEDSFWIFDGKSFNELIIVIGIADNSHFDIKCLIEYLEQNLSQYQVPVTYSISHSLDNLNNLGIETQLVRALLRKNLIYGESSILYREELSISSSKENIILDSTLEKTLATYIQTNQRGFFFKELEKLFKIWEKIKLSQSELESLLKHIIKLCQKNSVKQATYSSTLKLETDEILSSSKDYSTLLQGMRFVFDQFFTSAQKSDEKTDVGNEMIKTVEEYLNKCFSDSININDIAKMVNIHPVYLSRLFKSIKGISPMEYLTTLRIQKAKELLLSDSNLNLKEISEIVGYADQFYFSRIFKSITGMSPSVFKNVRVENQS